MHIKENYLSADVLHSLQKCFNSNIDSSFTGTYKIHEDIYKLYDLFPAFKPYVESILDKDCNLLHMVCLRSIVGSECTWHISDEPSDSVECCGSIMNMIHRNIQAEQAVYKVSWADEHPMNKLRLVSKHTTVFYLDVPEDIKGGELHICLAIARPAIDVVDDRFITPKTNMLVQFDGAHYHRVLKIKKASRPRLAIACQQHKLSKRNMKLLSSKPISQPDPNVIHRAISEQLRDMTVDVDSLC